MPNPNPTVEKGAIIAIIIVVIASILFIVTAASLIDDAIERNRERRAAQVQAQPSDEDRLGWNFGDIQTSIMDFFSQFFSPTDREPHLPTETIPPNWEDPPVLPDAPAYMFPATVDIFTDGFPWWPVDASAVHNGRLYYASVEPDTGIWVNSISPDGSALHETFFYPTELEEDARIFAFYVLDTGHYRFLTRTYDNNAVFLTYHRHTPEGTVSASVDLSDISPIEHDQFALSQALFTDDGLVISAYTGAGGALYLLDTDLSLRGALEVSWPSQIVQARDGRLFNIEPADANAPYRFLLREIRITAGNWGETVPFPIDTLSFLRSADPDAAFDLHFDRYRNGTVYFYGYTFATEEHTRLLRWTEASERIQPAHSVAFWPDGRISILQSRYACLAHGISDEPCQYHTSLTVLSPPPF